MPANLPPQYYDLEREFNAERDPREKLRMAEELLRMMPKHKGTDKLQADMKAKISKLKKQIETGGAKHGVRQVAAHDHIEKEGAGQAILIGPPNGGKSSLLDALTGAEPEIGDWPYTTREPMPGMMPFETVQIQLIDTPPISDEQYEGYLSGLIRNADLVVVVADLEAETMIPDLEFLLSKLEEKRIVLQPEVTEEPEDPRFSYKPTVICAHKEYEDESGEKVASLKKLFPGFPVVATSILDEASLDRFRRTVFDALKIIRVYTKAVGHDPDYKDPIILKPGATIEDAALALHKDFVKKLKFAKVWGKAAQFDGQQVNKSFELADESIVEFHI